ncbi:putative trehalase [Platanthera zijinensis]|uniref:Trehalase n=1 Tax=Platanthera zijinensis TaxID=2320716 RepID=A0AAP0GFV7_9ASPA
MASYSPLLLCTLLILLIFSAAAAAVSPAIADSCTAGSPTENSTPLVSFLQRVQSAARASANPKSFDPKSYVDLPLKHDLKVTESAFDDLPRVPGAAVHGVVPYFYMREFLKKYFGKPGDDLVYVEPKDYSPEPEGFLPKVKNHKVRVWALEVHSLWKNLSRRVSDDVKERPDRHTLLPLPEPVIIPGSRFKEVYYWDSYWIVRGLLVSKMYDTAKSIVSNLLWLVDTYGHPLNGARVYYTNRSQPPLLSSMVMEIYTKTGDLEFVKKSLPALLKEHSFWTSGVHKVMIRDLQGRKHSLSRYYAKWNSPRPESATIDEDSASSLPSPDDKKVFYREVASAAETGWDFSSRWMRNSSVITTLSTTLIIPVDLNAYLYKVELDIAFFAKKLGHRHTYENYLKSSKARQSAMRSILWNKEMNQWLDYWLNSDDCQDVHQFEAKNQNANIYVSNFIPMWNWKHASGEDEDRSPILRSFEVSGLIQPAGISTSLLNSGQQWDLPNGWAPLQHMIIEGLSNSGSETGSLLAEKIAVSWIRTNYAAYKTTGAMHEKYNVESCGKVGGGGEYVPQTGFGWSNGVLLALLEEYGWPSEKEIGCH